MFKGSFLALATLMFSFGAQADVFRGVLKITNPIYQANLEAEIFLDSSGFRDVAHQEKYEVIATEFGSSPCIDCDPEELAWACKGSLTTRDAPRVSVEYRLVLEGKYSLSNPNYSGRIFAHLPDVGYDLIKLPNKVGSCEAPATEDKLREPTAKLQFKFLNSESQRVDIDPIRGVFCNISATFTNPVLSQPLAFEKTRSRQWTLRGLKDSRFAKVTVEVQSACYTGRMTNDPESRYERIDRVDRAVLVAQ